MPVNNRAIVIEKGEDSNRQYQASFKPQDNDPNAIHILKTNFNPSQGRLNQYVENTRNYILKVQMPQMINNYIDHYGKLVKVASKYCGIEFVPEQDVKEIIPPILQILNS